MVKQGSSTFGISSVPRPPISAAQNPEQLDLWIERAYITLKQLTYSVNRLQGNQSTGQISQGTGGEGPPGPDPETTEININTLIPHDIIIVVDGVIYPYSVEGVNAALQKAKSKGGGTVMVPAGANIQIYEAPVLIPNRCTLEGFGSYHNTGTFVGNSQTNVEAAVMNESQDGTQQFCGLKNISVFGDRGAGSQMTAGIMYKNGCYAGSFIRDCLVLSCPENGYRFDGGATHGVGTVIVDNCNATGCGADNILVTGICGDGMRFYNIDSESVDAGFACLRIELGSAPTASSHHTINGYWSEGLNAADTIVLDSVSNVTIIDAFYDGANHNSVVKIIGSVGGSDGAFGGSSHLFLNIRGSIATIIDDQSSGVVVGTNYGGGVTGSRFVSMYKSPVATPATPSGSAKNVEQMYGIQPQRQGPSTASASTITLTDGSYFPITGSTAMNNITNAARFKGKLMVTKTDSAVTFVHDSGGTGNIRGADGADVNCATDTRVLWFSDGTNWWEVARSSASAASSSSLYLRRDGSNTVTGTIDWNGNVVANWRGSSGSLGGAVNIVSTLGAISDSGIRLHWQSGGNPASGYYPLAVQYTDATGIRDVMKVGYASSANGVLWLPDKDGGNYSGITGYAIVCGQTNEYNGAENCAIRFLPDGIANTPVIDFMIGATTALRIRSSGSQVQFAVDWIFNFAGLVRVSATTRDALAGSFMFGYQDGGTNTTGFHSGFYDGNTPGTGAQDTGRVFGVAYQGDLYVGKPGRSAVTPAEAPFTLRSSGWVAASSSNNQAGTNMTLAAGPGTGNSTTGGGIIFQTPDAGASGTAVQALTTKWTITRAGVLTAAEAMDIAAGTTTGTKIGTATTQKFGFYNATPVVQRADSGALTDSTGGTADGTLVDVGAVPTQANINDNFADCAAKISALRTALRDLGLMA